MMRLLFSLITILAIGSTWAQSLPHNWSVKAGAVFSTLPGAGESVKTSPKAGVQLGLSYSLPISNQFSFVPTLNLVEKGDIRKVTFPNSGETSKRTTTAYWLEVPLLLNYDFKLNSNSSVSIYAGPYLAYGLGGKSRYSRPNVQREAEEYSKQTFGSGTWNPSFQPTNLPSEKDPLLCDQGKSSWNPVTEVGVYATNAVWGQGYKRFDYGATFGVGYNYGRLTFGLTTSIGVAKIAAAKEIKQKNISTGITTGWRF